MASLLLGPWRYLPALFYRRPIPLGLADVEGCCASSFLPLLRSSFLDGKFIQVCCRRVRAGADRRIPHRGHAGLEPWTDISRREICNAVPHVRSSLGADSTLPHHARSRYRGVYRLQRQPCSADSPAFRRALPLLARKRHSADRHHGRSSKDCSSGTVRSPGLRRWLLAGGTALWIYGAPT